MDWLKIMTAATIFLAYAYLVSANFRWKKPILGAVLGLVAYVSIAYTIWSLL